MLFICLDDFQILQLVNAVSMAFLLITEQKIHKKTIQLFLSQ